MVDGGSEANKEMFLSVCEKHGINPKDISLIILSHGHVDHYVNMATVKAITGAPLMMHKLAEDTVANAKRPTMYPRNELGEKIWADTVDNDPVPVVYPAQADIVVEGDVDLRPYGIDGMLKETKGHSDCSYSVFLNDGDVIVGDVILNCPMDNSIQFAWFSNDVAALKNSIQLILKDAKTIYSGHGGPFDAEQIKELYLAEFQ